MKIHSFLFRITLWGWCLGLKEEFLSPHSCLREITPFSSGEEDGETSDGLTLTLMSFPSCPLGSNDCRKGVLNSAGQCPVGLLLLWCIWMNMKGRERGYHESHPHRKRQINYKTQGHQLLRWTSVYADTKISNLGSCSYKVRVGRQLIIFSWSVRWTHTNTQLVFWLEVLFGGGERKGKSLARKK